MRFLLALASAHKIVAAVAVLAVVAGGFGGGPTR